MVAKTTRRAVVPPIAAPTEDQSIGFETQSSTGYGWSATPTCSVLSPKSNSRASDTPSTGSHAEFNGSGRTAHVDYVIVRR